MKSFRSFTFLFLFLFIYRNLVSAQNRTNQIKIAPGRFIDLVNPGLEISYEKFYAQRFSTQVSVAYLNDPFHITNFGDYRGWRFSLEEKYYQLPQKKEQNYFAAELVYMNMDYTGQSNYSKDTSLTSRGYSDTFNVQKQTFSLNIKYGIQIPLHRFVIDISAGLGIKYKIVGRNGVDDPTAYELSPVDPNAYYMANKPGKYFGINLPVSVKLGFSF